MQQGLLHPLAAHSAKRFPLVLSRGGLWLPKIKCRTKPQNSVLGAADNREILFSISVYLSGCRKVKFVQRFSPNSPSVLKAEAVKAFESHHLSKMFSYKNKQ